MENHKATKPVFNVGPTSARQENAISGIWILSSTHQLKKQQQKLVRVGSPQAKPSGSAHGCEYIRDICMRYTERNLFTWWTHTYDNER